MPKRKRMTLSSKDCDVKTFKNVKTKLGSATPMDGIPSKKTGHSGYLSDEILSRLPTNVDSVREFKMCKVEPAKCGLMQNGQLNDSGAGYITPTSKIKLKTVNSTETPSPESGLLDTTSRLACAFCHSSEESEISGVMLHYDHGKLVDGDKALNQNVVHVHQKCIDWAPAVYFENGIVKNLEKEVARAARLKCSKCKQKGAPLGCYIESCRKTYHAPCAVQLSDCRWDIENFWLLCPTHFLEPFPSDRARTEEKVRIGGMSTIPLGQREACHSSSNPSTSEIEMRDKVMLRNKYQWRGSVEMSGKWVVGGSALSKDDCILLTKFGEVTGATIAREWNSSVTHVIAATDEFGACRRTLEYLMAILNAKWILKVEWIKACLEAQCPVAEVNYEIFHDIHGFFGGPLRGRMRVIEKAPPLFNGLSFYFTRHFDPSYKGHLEELVLAAGGTILKEIMPRFGLKAMVPSNLIVCNLEMSGGRANQSGIFKEATILASRTGFHVVAHTWIFDSIAACEIQNL